MIVIRWSLTVVLAVMALLLDVGNLAGPVVARRRGRNFSAVPLYGALFGSGACLLCPFAGSAKLIPVAILLDISVANLTVYALKRIAARVR